MFKYKAPSDFRNIIDLKSDGSLWKCQLTYFHDAQRVTEIYGK